MDEAAKLAIEKLEALARAVGVRVDEFYPYVVKNVLLDAIETTLVCAAVLVASLLCVRGLIGWYRSDGFDFGQEECGVPFCFGVAAVGVAVLASSIVILCSISELVNPEYYAIKDIVQMLKP